ncbi:MAG: hypothetical protein WAX69_00575 [Victivallales bacterium]
MFNSIDEVIPLIDGGVYEKYEKIMEDGNVKGGYKMHCPVCQKENTGNEELKLLTYVTKNSTMSFRCDGGCSYNDIIKAFEIRQTEMFAVIPDENDLMEVEMSDDEKPDTTDKKLEDKKTTDEKPKDKKPTKPTIFGLFWTQSESSYNIQAHKLMDWLNKQGYGQHEYDNDNSGAKESIFIKVDGNIVRKISTSEIRQDIEKWIKINVPQLQAHWTKNIQKLTNNMTLETKLEKHTDKFHRDDKSTVYLYYKNGVLEVTKDTCLLKKYEEINACIWQRHVINRDYIEDKASGELEKFFMNINNNDIERYNRMITAIGYMIHRFKSKAVCKSVIFNDESLEDQEGGTGKGLILQAIGKVRQVQKLDMRTRQQNQFMFGDVNPDSDIVHLEDVNKDFDFGDLFNVISGNFEIEGKGKDRISIPFEESPKVVISTNFAVRGVGHSVNRRKAEYELYKHYNKTLTPLGEFGHYLFDDWTKEEWNKFDTWAVKAVQYYLSNGLIEGDNKTTDIKKLMAETSATFIKFMDEWKLTMKLKEIYVKPDFYSAYIEATDDDVKLVTKNIINKWLKTWADFNGHKYFDKQKKIGLYNKHVFWFE